MEMTFADELAQQASERPDKIFLWFDDEPVTFAQAKRQAMAAANQLLALGLRPGDTVALFAASSPEWVATWLGAASVGIRTTPINLAYRGELLRNQLRETGAKAILVDAALQGRLAEVAASLPELRLLLVGGVGDLPAISGVTAVPAGELSEGEPDRLTGGRPLRWDEPATVFYTSGTTGPSKGALLTQQYLCRSAAALNERYGTEADDIMYAALPLFHASGAMGVVLASLVSGRTSALDSAFHVGTCWDRVRHFGATQFFGVGAMIMMLWNLPPAPSDAELPFRLLISAPVPADLHRPLEERYRCKVVVGYGLTEAMLIASHRVDEPIVPGSLGRPGPLYDVALLDASDSAVPAGQVGEIAIRPRNPHVMFEGYLGRPTETLAQMSNLWFHTGDLGRFDDDGLLYYVDRKKDAIRRRGENISSFEVEQAVLAHPAVLECAAHAVPSPLGEDDVKVCVVVRPGHDLDPSQVWLLSRDRLPAFAVPQYIELLDGLPKNQVGRVQKHLLRERGVTPATWAAPAGVKQP